MSIANELRELLGSEEAKHLIYTLRSQMRAGSPRSPDPRPLYMLLGRKRLLAPHWPSEFGGRDGTLTDTIKVIEGLIAHDVPETAHTLSVMVAGTLFLIAGTRSQQRAYLPGIASGESLVSLLFTEDAAGSDAASISTSATELPSGGYSISGEKRFCAYVDVARYALITVRSARSTTAHGAMSIFVIEPAAQGVSIESIPTISDEPLFGAALKIEVPAEALVGEFGQGWELMNRGLVYERFGIDFAAKALSRLDRTAATLSLSDSAARAEAGSLISECAAARALAHRMVAEVAAGNHSFIGIAMAKWYAARAAQRVTWWSAEVAVKSSDGERADAARIDLDYAGAPGYAIAAGTAEMMLESIAATAAPENIAALSTASINDPIEREFLKRLRGELASSVEEPGARAANREIARLVLPLDLPSDAGGFELGLPLVALACEELGRSADERLVGAMTAADVIASAGPSSPLWSELRDLIDGRWIPTFAQACSGEFTPALGSVALFTGRLTGRYFNSADGIVALQAVNTRTAAYALDRAGVQPRTTIRGLESSGLTVQFDAVEATALGFVDLPRIETRRHVREAAYLTGIATASLGIAATYLHSRHQFGRRLADFQYLSLTLASLLAEREAASAATAAVANAVAEEDIGSDTLTSALQAHSLAAASALRSTRWTLHVYGARGLTAASPAAVYYHEAIGAARGSNSPRALAMKVGERYFAARRPS